MDPDPLNKKILLFLFLASKIIFKISKFEKKLISKFFFIFLISKSKILPIGSIIPKHEITISHPLLFFLNPTIPFLINLKH